MNLTIKLILQELVRRIWIIILCAVIGFVAAFCYTKYNVAPIYQSTMKMSTLINLSDDDKSSVGTYINMITLGERRVETYMELVKTTKFYSQVAEASGTGYTADAVRSMLYFQQVEGMGIFTVTITGADPQAIYLIGQAVASEMPVYIDDIQDNSQLAVLEPAVKPTYPINDTLKKNAITGALIGALLAIAVFSVIALLDTHIKDDEALSKRYPDIPILGAIPDFKVLTNKRSR